VIETGSHDNTSLTVFLLVEVVPYSGKVQQPIRATAALNGRPHTRHAARFIREQGSAAGLHPEGQYYKQT